MATKIILFFSFLYYLFTYHLGHVSGLEVFGSNSTKDGRQYGGLLLDNELKVILVSDPNTETAAVSLYVPVGSMYDPEDFLGMAHFVEHMIFLQYGKYPEKDALNKFLSKHGGATNAGTYNDYTEYYYTVNANALQPSLDRFADMFISPTFADSDLEAEVEAVDSEFNVNYANDETRIYRIKKLTANASHHFTKFIVGNRNTLWNDPQQKGLDVRMAVMDFYEKYYSSNIMTLSILGQESLEELEEMVEKIFTQIPNKNSTAPSTSFKPYGPEEFHRIAQIFPVSDYRQVTLSFECPTHPYPLMAYFGELMNHKGTGSLSSFLKHRKYATSVAVSVGEYYKSYNVFEVTISLTELGLLYLNSVIEHVFEYIKLLDDERPPGENEDEWYWKEKKNISQISTKFGNKKTPLEAVSFFAKCLMTVSMEDILSNIYFSNSTQVYDVDSADEAFDALKPDKMRIYVVAKAFENKTNLVDPIYGIQYNWDEIDPVLIKAWSNVQRNSQFLLPAPNKFIPSKFDLKYPDEKHLGIPRLINDSSLSQIWFLQDNEYLSPNAIIYVELFSPISDVTPVASILNWISSDMMPQFLVENAYGATLVDQTYSFQDTRSGKTILVKGYNDNVQILLSQVMNSVANFTPDSYQFEITRTDYKQRLHHLKNRQSCDITNTESFILERKWTTEDLLAVIDDITFDDLLRFVEDFVARMKFHWFFYGNLTPEEAMEMASKSQNMFSVIHGTKSLISSEITRNREIELSKGSHWLYTKETSTHINTCTKLIFQSDGEVETNSLQVELLKKLASVPAFIKLRSQEELGYVVTMGTFIYSRGVESFQIYVQGDKNPAFVEYRIDNFLTEFNDNLSSMTEKEFNEHKMSLMEEKKAYVRAIEVKSLEYWNEIVYNTFNFRRKEREIELLSTINLTKFKKFLKEFVGIDGETQRRLSIHVIPRGKVKAYRQGKCFECTNSSDERLPPNMPYNHTLIKNIATWKRKQRIYGN